MKSLYLNALRSFYPLPVGLALFFGGCLLCESTEYSITLNAEGKGGTIVTVMRNIQSGETEPAKQQKDFEQAIQSWKGDDYLLERMHDGLYIKDRSLSIEDNVLVWREKGVFSDLAEVFKREIKNDTLRLVIKGDQKIVATNGSVSPSNDSTVVVWSLDSTRQIYLKTKESDFHPTSDFAAKFKAYLKQSN